MIRCIMHLFQNAVSINTSFVLFSKNCSRDLRVSRTHLLHYHSKYKYGSTDVLPPHSHCWHCQTQNFEPTQWYSDQKRAPYALMSKIHISCHWSVVLLPSSATVSHAGYLLSGHFPRSLRNSEDIFYLKFSLYTVDSCLLLLVRPNKGKYILFIILRGNCWLAYYECPNILFPSTSQELF